MNQKIEFITTVEIEVAPKKVWDIFLDTSKYSQWNPFIKRLYGKIELNKTILEFAYFYDYIYLPILMKVIEYEPEKKIIWVGNFPGFSDHHIYKFEKTEKGNTFFSHSAKFEGLFAINSKDHINKNVRRVHEEMNLALKKRAEE